MARQTKESNMLWGSNSLKERFHNPVSILFIIFIFFYLIQALISLFSEISPPLIDFFTVTSVIVFAFVLHLFLKFKKTVPLMLGIGFMFHIIGLYNIIPYNIYYTGTLYGAPQLNYHYDWIVHSIGFGFLAIAYCSAVYPYFKKAFSSNLAIFSLLLLSMMGFGALNEVSEFIGYEVFGHGEGFMEFGDGDISPDSGPWRNASMDLINNFIGGIVFIGSFVIAKKNTKNLKKTNKNVRNFPPV